jgi:hypothetical protein
VKAVEFADPKLQAGFTQIPNVILRDASLSAGARVTYAVLQSFAWQADECWVGQKKLGELVGVKERSIQNYLGELTAAGLLEIKRQGLNKVNRYVLFGAPLDTHVGAGPDTHSRADKEDSVEEDTTTERLVRKVGKKVVTNDEYTLAAAVVSSFNEVAGTRLTTDANLVPVVGRIRERPDLTADNHAFLIRAVFAAKHWWTDPAGIKIIYGNPEIFETSIEKARAAAKRKSSPSFDVNAEAARIRKAQGLG